MNDAQLHQLLREYPAPVSLPASFNREVWTRIEAVDATSVRAALLQLGHALLSPLSRPAPALAFVAVCMLLGGGFGWIQHRKAFHTQGALA